MQPRIGAVVTCSLVLLAMHLAGCATVGCDALTSQVEFITPHDDPTSKAAPDSEFVFRRSDVAKYPSQASEFTLTIPVSVRLKDGSLAGQHPEAIRFRIDDIPGATMRWSTPSSEGNWVSATVTFEGLPVSFTAFGRKSIDVLMPAGQCIGSQVVEVFYDGLDWSPYRKRKVPNWLFFYTQNAMAQNLAEGRFKYGCYKEVPGQAPDRGVGSPRAPDRKSRSSADNGAGEGSILICDDAYNGANTYLIAARYIRPLTIVGYLNSDLLYYTSFVAILMHELDHANNNVEIGERSRDGLDVDSDDDGLVDTWEREITHTDPAAGLNTIDDHGKEIILPNSETFASSVVERCAARHADTSQDWASPGTHYREGFALYDPLPDDGDGKQSARECVPDPLPRRR